MLDNLAGIIGGFGGLVFSIDTFIGKNRLTRLEAFLRRELLHLSFGDVFNSYIAYWLQLIFFIPMYLLQGPSDARAPKATFSSHNRSRAKYLRGLVSEDNITFIDIGTRPNEWLRSRDGRPLNVHGYFHIYPHGVRSVYVGQQLNGRWVKSVTIRHPDDIDVQFSPTPITSSDAALMYFYVAPLVRHPWRRGHLLEIPRNSLFGDLNRDGLIFVKTLFQTMQSRRGTPDDPQNLSAH